MADVNTLLSDIRAALEEVEEKIREHPYLVALEKGEIKRERLTIFAGEQYHIISSDLRSVAPLLSRMGDAPVSTSSGCSCRERWRPSRHFSDSLRAWGCPRKT